MADVVPCWICGANDWRVFKPSTLKGGISSDDFKITDARYGHTGQIDVCLACGFKQVKDIAQVTRFYETLDDAAYDQDRAQRGLQARKILEAIRAHKPSGRLLDIGAASGILLEQAAQLGYVGEGIEPSTPLAQRARTAGLNVRTGIFPHPDARGPYDIITLIDVLEHVPTPIPLLRDIGEHLKPDGVGVLTTPDADSLTARLLGPRWWHYRVAHIGYFNKPTLTRALDAAGLQIVNISRPAWFFTYAYAAERAMVYLPRLLHFKLPRAIRDRTVRVNFRDSLQVIFKRK